LSNESLGMEEDAINVGLQVEEDSDLPEDKGNLEVGEDLLDEGSPEDQELVEDDAPEEIVGELEPAFEIPNKKAPNCPRCGMLVTHPQGTWRPFVGRKLKCANCQYVWKP
jgi:hypothetical protein